MIIKSYGSKSKYSNNLNNRDNLSFNYKNYQDYNRLVNQNKENRQLDENSFKRIEVFPNLILLDLSENRIEIIPPNAFKLLPKLQHLSLISNNIQKIYGRSFIFSNNQTELENSDSETIITDLDKIFDQTVDEYLKNKSISKPKLSNEFYNYGTFSFENKTLQSNESEGKEIFDNIVNIYLGANDLDCTKINQFAFIKIEKLFTIHLDLNNFDYLCEDLFENLLFNDNLQWINLHKNAIKCLHCGNRWLFSSKMRLESRSQIDKYEKIRDDKLKKFKQLLYGRNYSTQYTNLIQPIAAGKQVT